MKINDIIEVIHDAWSKPEVPYDNEFNLPKGSRLIVDNVGLDSRGMFMARRLAKNEVDILHERHWYLYPSEVEVVGHYL